MALNYGKAFLVAALLAGTFVIGAYWAVEELWPYEVLRRLKYQSGVSSPPTSHRLIVTDLATLELNLLSAASRVPIHRTGGGIDAFDDNVLIMSFRGEFFLYEGMSAERPFTPLNIAMDNGYDSYRAYLAASKLNPENAATYFRFIDVVYDREHALPALWVSHHQWHEGDACYTLRLSRLGLVADLPLKQQTAVSADWQAIYDTTPCLPLNAAAPWFEGHFSGGRIVVMGPDSVLMSVGDHGFNGWTIPQALPQDISGDYGKILLVQPSIGLATHVSIGHRNPQGLLVDADGQIWSTEHGPRGGDELNLISYGGNYGWPEVTYGAAYGMSRWPLSETQGRHDGYAKPVYAWLPSIGISNLIQVERFLPVWNGDLLVSSMREKTLHRIRYVDGRVIFDESIEIGQRVRDLDQLDDGTIIIWTNDAAIIEIRPAMSVEPDIEEIVARLPDLQRRQALSTIGSCLQCHNATPGGEASSAPNLWGVFGRRIAGTGFDGYSTSLKARSGNWNDATLDAFLSDVQGFSRGSTMAFPGISDAAIRATVIDYLKALTPASGQAD